MKICMYFAHQGMGDLISDNGLVRTLKKSYDKVIVLVWAHQIPTISYMYRDDQNIVLEPIISGREIQGILQSLNKFNPEVTYVMGPELEESLKTKIVESSKLIYFPFLENWKKYGSKYDSHQLRYLGASIPFSCRFSNFYYEREPNRENALFEELNLEEKNYIFVHDDESRGYKININNNTLKVVTNNPQYFIFDYRKVIEQAHQVHCMESSFRCLIETFNPTGDLFFHHYVRKTDPLIVEDKFIEGSTSKNWNVIL